MSETPNPEHGRREPHGERIRDQYEGPRDGAPRADGPHDEVRRDDVHRHHGAGPVDDRGAALPPRKSKGLGIAAMICGIVGLLLLFVPLIQFASIILCPLAIILGIIAAKKREGRGQGIAGIITGTIGVLLIAAGVIFIAIYGDEILEWAEEAEQEVNVVLNLPS